MEKIGAGNEAARSDSLTGRGGVVLCRPSAAATALSDMRGGDGFFGTGWAHHGTLDGGWGFLGVSVRSKAVSALRSATAVQSWTAAVSAAHTGHTVRTPVFSAFQKRPLNGEPKAWARIARVDAERREPPRRRRSASGVVPAQKRETGPLIFAP